jgi:hypothetical protein
MQFSYFFQLYPQRLKESVRVGLSRKAGDREVYSGEMFVRGTGARQGFRSSGVQQNGSWS